MNKNIIILSDFDGTITNKDVGTALIKNFGPDGWKEYEKKYIKREISSKDSLSFYYENMKRPTNGLLDYVDNNIKLDDYFLSFYNYIKEKNYDFYIVSDGMDFYIDFILKKYDLNDIPFYSNTYIDKTNVETKYPYFNLECGMCGNCKYSHLNNLSDESTFTIYIGDGHSDRCVADKVDLTFAKDDLEKYCKDRDIKYIKFNDFSDVLKIIKMRGI